jgi:hypothetical protein
MHDAGTNTGADSGGANDSGAHPDPEPGTDGGVSRGPCDFTGIWIARQNTQSLALGAKQFANNWYYLELEQTGDEIVVKDHFDCGIDVRGTVVVQLAPNTTRALMQHNREAGRKARVEQHSDGTCGLSFEHFWSVRGVSEETFVPKPRNTSESLEAIQARLKLPDSAAQTEDWDGDGEPGIQWVINSNGYRHSIQRDWQRWFTAPGYEIVDREDWPDDLLIRAEFSNEEIVFKVSSPLYQLLSTPDSTAEHTLTLRFLGRSAADARAKAIIQADDFDTCIAVQNALPAIKALK